MDPREFQKIDKILRMASQKNRKALIKLAQEERKERVLEQWNKVKECCWSCDHRREKSCLAQQIEFKTQKEMKTHTCEKFYKGDKNGSS